MLFFKSVRSNNTFAVLNIIVTQTAPSWVVVSRKTFNGEVVFFRNKQKSGQTCTQQQYDNNVKPISKGLVTNLGGNDHSDGRQIKVKSLDFLTF